MSLGDYIQTQSILWLDASYAPSLFKDAGGTTAVTASGDTVNLWRDRSPAKNHATALTAAQWYPAVGVRRVGSVTGMCYRFANPRPLSGRSAYSVFYVCTVTGDVKNTNNINVQSPFGEETTTVGTSWLAYGTAAQTQMWWSVQIGFGSAGATIVTDNIAAGLSLYCVVAEPGTGKTTVYRNGLQLYQSQAHASGAAAVRLATVRIPT